MPRSTFYYHLKGNKTDKYFADKQAIKEVITVTQPAEDNSATVPDENSVGCEPAQTERENIHTVPKQRQMTRKELFEELYRKSADIRKKRERKAYVQREMLPYFKDSTSCRAFVEKNFERKHRNMVCRKIRLWRKINQQTFNYFVTFTFGIAADGTVPDEVY